MTQLDRTSYVWLRFSGLPEQLGPETWTLYETLCALDSYLNIDGRQYVQMPVDTLKDITGLSQAKIEKALNRLFKKKLLRYSIANHPLQASLFKLTNPLDDGPKLRSETIADLEQSQAAVPQALVQLVRRSARYAYPPFERDLSLPKKMDKDTEAKLQQICDLYYNHFGQVTTIFVIDRLRNIAQRCTVEQVRSAFENAQKQKLGFHSAERSLLGKGKHHVKK